MIQDGKAADSPRIEVEGGEVELNRFPYSAAGAFEALDIKLVDGHVQVTAANWYSGDQELRHGSTKITIYSPRTDLLEAIRDVCQQEIERREALLAEAAEVAAEMAEAEAGAAAQDG